MISVRNDPSDYDINADQVWEVAWTYIRTVVDTVREPFLILDGELKILSANKTFYSTFQVGKAETVQKKIYDIGNGQWNLPKLKTLLEDILPKNTFFEDFKVDHKFPHIGKKTIVLNARKVYREYDKKPIILLAMEDTTRQMDLEDQLKEYAKKLTQEVRSRAAVLEIRVNELERMNKIMVGREVKMIKLKEELAKFKESKLM